MEVVDGLVWGVYVHGLSWMGWMDGGTEGCMNAWMDGWMSSEW